MLSHNQTLKRQDDLHKLLKDHYSLFIQGISETRHISPRTVRRNIRSLVIKYPNINRFYGRVAIDACVPGRFSSESNHPY
ncbi:MULTISPECIES: DeoR family transcriptional regulator [Yersinia]|uniref:DeoR family transcriptional regulator n=1 Tax=Yersinia TaxID=629 RepID=UPI000903FCE1|nr:MULTISPECIES: DeoR family transcriptional regulator [Yersinia]